MFALRLFTRRSAAVAGLFLAVAASSALADIPVEPFPVPTPENVEAPLKVTISGEADAQATLVIPRRFVEQAGAAGIAPASAAPKSNSLLAILGTIAGGGALSLGVLILGIYFIRRSNGRRRTMVAGTAAAIALFLGAGAVFADLLPFSQGNRPPREPRSNLPNVKVVIVEEGEAIELTLPKALVQATR